jgi:hypothetical protein
MRVRSLNYSEKERKIRHCQREVPDSLFKSAILGALTPKILNHKPKQVIEQRKENAEYEQSKGPLLDLVSIKHHVNGSCAHCQVDKVGSEEQNTTSEHCVNSQYYFSESKPRDITKAQTFSNSDRHIVHSLRNAFFLLSHFLVILFHRLLKL